MMYLQRTRGEGGVQSGVKYLIYINVIARRNIPISIVLRNYFDGHARERALSTQPTRSHAEKKFPDVYIHLMSLISIFLPALWPLFSHINRALFFIYLLALAHQLPP
jgi:hypothetical protein